MATYHRACDAGLERRLYLLLHEFVEVDVLREEGVLLDVVRAVHAQAMGGIARQQTGEDTPRLRADLVAEDKRVLQNLLVHDLGVLCRPNEWSYQIRLMNKLTIVEGR